MEDGREVESSSMWRHLPLLVRASSKESVEYILKLFGAPAALASTPPTDKYSAISFNSPIDCRLDPLLVCLRVLIRRCVYDNVNKDEIHKLFPAQVVPELQRLLTLLLQKFQKEWREDIISKDQSMTWNMANQTVEQREPVAPAAVINLKLHGDEQTNLNERDVKFQLAKDTMEMMLNSMYCIRDQLCEPGETPNGHVVQNSNVV